MRVVAQRVSEASVRWDGGEASIGPGYCLLVGVADTDNERDADYLADKILKLRVFSDEAGKFNLSATQVNADFLVVSQFTLFADARGPAPARTVYRPPSHQRAAGRDRVVRSADGGPADQRRPGHCRAQHRRMGATDRLTRPVRPTGRSIYDWLRTRM